MQISDAEWTVMNLVWDSQPIDARSVVAALADDNGWSAATVKTMLHRLVKKGALAHDPDGKRYQYRAIVRRRDCVRRASRSFVDRVFGGETAPALLHLVKSAKLSADEVDQLRAILDDKDQGNGR
ncbi:MAG: BlaI/MecI/CopY family transcriptional regulator [Rubripirellula sp.]